MGSYLDNKSANPLANRVPWRRYTAPCYASIFLWVGFSQPLAQGTIDRAGFGTLLFGLVTAAVLSYALFYHVPAMLGWKTGYPLGVVGSSTFGATGGRLVPGLLMGVLQTAWFGVATFFGTSLTLSGLGMDARPGTLPFAVMAVVWGYALAYVGMKGIRLVAGIAVIVNVIALVAMLAIFFTAKEGLQFHSVEEPEPLLALGLLVQTVTAFFATAGAAAPEFGLHNRTAKDVVLGGIAGVFLPMIFAGALAMLTVTGARALNPAVQGYGYITACAALSASFPVRTDLLLAITCIPAAGVFAFIASNSFTVMLPGVRRLHSTMTCATVAIAFAITGIPGNLEAFITIAGALFAPICGAMAADFVQAAMKWPHTRPGVNYAGYGAWVLGFLVGILPVLSESETLQAAAQPAAVYSFIIGFVAYIVLGNVGLKPYRKRVRKRTTPHS